MPVSPGSHPAREVPGALAPGYFAVGIAGSTQHRHKNLVLPDLRQWPANLCFSRSLQILAYDPFGLSNSAQNGPASAKISVMIDHATPFLGCPFNHATSIGEYSQKTSGKWSRIGADGWPTDNADEQFTPI